MSDELAFEVIEPRGELTEGKNEGTVSDLKRFDHDEYGASVAVVIETEGGATPHAFYNLPEDGVSSQHKIGALCERFGADLDDSVGQTLSVPEFVGKGTKVEFLMQEEEQDDGSMELEIVNESVSPLGSGGASDGDDDESGEPAEISPGLQGILDEVDTGTLQAQVMGEVASVDAGLVEEFKTLVESGDIQFDSEDGYVGY